MNRFSVLMAVLLFAVLLLPNNSQANDENGSASYENHSLLRAGPFSEDVRIEFLRGGFDIIQATKDGVFEVVAIPREMEELISRFNAEIIIDNIEEYQRKGLDPSKAMGGYHIFDEIIGEAVIWSTLYPALVKMDTIGYSLEGQPIFALKISDNVEIDEDEPEVFFNSLIHAREPIGMETLVYFINHLLTNQGIAEIDDIINNTEIWFVLVANPDGYIYNEMTNPGGGGMYRKNRKDNGDGSFGVDLNRNWGFLWGLDEIGSSSDTYSPTYRGTGPFSEPETQVMRDFILAHEFQIVVNYHCYSNVYLTPWDFSPDVLNPDISLFGPMLDSLQSFNGYDIGSLYPVNGGATDWQYGEQFDKKKIFTFLPEIGTYETYFWPPEQMIDSLCEDNLEANLFFVREAQKLWGSPTFSLSTAITHYDTLLNACDTDGFTSNIYLFNNKPDENLYIKCDTIMSSVYPGWFMVADTVRTILPNDSVSIDLSFSPSLLPTPIEEYKGVLMVAVSHDETFADADTVVYHMVLSFEWEDIDADMAPDNCDNCPGLNNPNQDDPDGDGVGTLCDICPDDFDPAQEDTDTDGIGNACDNCPDKSNPNQTDRNANNIGDLCEFVCGDANGDLATNIGDVVYTINFIFKGGVAPDPLISCDANCDNNCNIGDTVFLINYIFKGGSAPCFECQ